MWYSALGVHWERNMGILPHVGIFPRPNQLVLPVRRRVHSWVSEVIGGLTSSGVWSFLTHFKQRDC